MGLEDEAKAELLRTRKHSDGVTVGSMARSPVLSSVLGGGDPKIAYNSLKHSIFAMDSSLAVQAATYSLGLASTGKTHLDRLTDFGTEHGYDQRQARRHSDRGITEIARFVATQWTVEASPVLEVRIVGLTVTTIEVILHTERFHFIEMIEPTVELVAQDGNRQSIECEWHGGSDDLKEHAVTQICLSTPGGAAGLSVLWRGETSPLFRSRADTDLPPRTVFESVGQRWTISGY